MDQHPKTEKHHHHILPTKLALTIGVALLFLTIITVWVAGVDLGKLNFPVAMLIATIKATMVASIFMNLAYDRKENAVIFATSFLFLAIFISFTVSDIFFRGDVYVKKGDLEKAMAGGKAQFKKAWNPTPELVAKGKELFAQQCVSCHGPNGKGDGPAAGALNPKPRNFTQTEGWKNGRKPSMVFKTLKEGIPGTGMGSFATLPPDQRWALSHFVISLGPDQPKDTPSDFAKIGLDPTKEEGGEEKEASIPVALAMSRLAEAEPKLAPAPALGMAEAGAPGARIYQRNCVSCHGVDGKGGQAVRNLGVYPKAFAITEPLAGAALAQDRFNERVIRGIPGDLMPSFGHLSATELRDLYAYVRSLPAAR